MWERGSMQVILSNVDFHFILTQLYYLVKKIMETFIVNNKKNLFWFVRILHLIVYLEKNTWHCFGFDFLSCSLRVAYLSSFPWLPKVSFLSDFHKNLLQNLHDSDFTLMQQLFESAKRIAMMNFLEGSFMLH